MTNIDKKIEKIGYKIRHINRRINSIVYENIYQDQEITIEWGADDQDCFIFSNTITEQRDWYGQLYKEPMGLTITEIRLFRSKIQEGLFLFKVTYVGIGATIIYCGVKISKWAFNELKNEFKS